MFTIQFTAVFTVIGIVAGIILYWLKVMYERRDLVEWTVKFWLRAYEDGKVTVDEVVEFINQLIDRLGLKDKVIVERRV